MYSTFINTKVRRIDLTVDSNGCIIIICYYNIRNLLVFVEVVWRFHYGRFVMSSIEFYMTPKPSDRRLLHRTDIHINVDVLQPGFADGEHGNL